MNSRERVLTALNHKEPDRVPFDLGGTVVTGIQAKAYRRLRQYLGLPEKETVIIDILQQLAQVDDDVMEHLGVDVRNVSPRSTASFKIELKETPDRQYYYFYDEYQIGWRMPIDGGMYFDMFEHPLSGEITEETVDRYSLPDPIDPARFIGLRESARIVLEKEKRALVIGNMSAGIFELYMWTRGYKDGYADWAGNPDFAKKILRKYIDLQMTYWEKMFDVMKDIPIDVVQMADDLAGQNGMLISPMSYRQHLKPMHKEMFDYIHSKTDAKIFFHSCGSIRPIITDLIEIGVDILNPVQVSATRMDSAELKREYGNDLCFWGGGVDTQNAFDDRHTPDEVRADVRKRLEDFMPGGGFIFNTVHNIQGNVPPENIIAMWETVQEYGQYK
ncbi:MAG TPA: uroporphyrinogen decarboxylase family protein [Dehalococcoidales bacterium]